MRRTPALRRSEHCLLWFYAVVALFKKDSGHDQGARRFVTSFKVIE